ncbi:hypothetical protein EGM51_00565 [Verrucomicrobia bacterium S94]|nr:hypothetical protein EGM51_00565 [Verrucomicrobia bacterium S94]
MSDITVEDEVPDEGQRCYKIVTERATYLYQKKGCAFSSLLDRDGKDWISYRPKGGPKGHYRGIPNMGYETFGHPGYETGETTLLEKSKELVRLKSTADGGAWDVEWTFRTTHAEMRALHVASPVWLLYEGTPGGKFRPDLQQILFSDGTRSLCSQTRKLETPDPKWVAFCDPKTKRSVALAYDGPDRFLDKYWPMGGKGGMTVFGFGRTDEQGFGFLIKSVPFTFSFALVESISYEEVSAYVADYMPVRR